MSSWAIRGAFACTALASFWVGWNLDAWMGGR